MPAGLIFCVFLSFFLAQMLFFKINYTHAVSILTINMYNWNALQTVSHRVNRHRFDYFFKPSWATALWLANQSPKPNVLLGSFHTLFGPYYRRKSSPGPWSSMLGPRGSQSISNWNMVQDHSSARTLFWKFSDFRTNYRRLWQFFFPVLMLACQWQRDESVLFFSTMEAEGKLPVEL